MPKMRRYSHPEWEGVLVVQDNERGHADALDILNDTDDTPRADELTYITVEMTQAEIESLPDFDG